MTRRFTRHSNAPPTYQGLAFRMKAEHLNELQIALEDDDVRINQKADTSAVQGMVVQEVAAAPTVTDAAAAAVTTEIIGRNLVEGQRIEDDEIVGGLFDQTGRASWLTTTHAGGPPAHAKRILAEQLNTPTEIPDGWGWEFAVTDTAGRIAFGIRDDGSVFPASSPEDAGSAIETYAGIGRELLVRDALGSIRPLTSTPKRVAFWGDSLMQGYPAPPFAVNGSDSVPGVFGTLHPTSTVLNGGAGGRTADEITIRQGGLVIEVVPTGGSIPASGPVAMTTTQVIRRRAADMAFPGTVAGVPGTLTQTGATTFTFTRTTAGTAVPVPTPVPFLSTFGTGYFDAVMVACMGRNDVNLYPTTPDVVDRVVAANAALVASATPLSPRILLLGTTTATNETAGTTGHTVVTTINRTLAAQFPHFFWDYRRWLVDEAIYAMGITPTADDLAAMAADTLPPSLMVDSVHYNPATANAAAQRIYDELTSRGWL